MRQKKKRNGWKDIVLDLWHDLLFVVVERLVKIGKIFD